MIRLHSFTFVYTRLYLSRLVYNRLYSSSDSSPLVYIRLVTRLHPSTFVYTRQDSSSDSSVFLEQIVLNSLKKLIYDTSALVILSTPIIIHVISFNSSTFLKTRLSRIPFSKFLRKKIFQESVSFFCQYFWGKTHHDTAWKLKKLGLKVKIITLP